MDEPTPHQTRAAQIREAHLRADIGNLYLRLAQVAAERDAYAEENAWLTAELARQKTEQPT